MHFYLLTLCLWHMLMRINMYDLSMHFCSDATSGMSQLAAVMWFTKNTSADFIFHHCSLPAAGADLQ